MGERERGEGSRRGEEMAWSNIEERLCLWPRVRVARSFAHVLDRIARTQHATYVHAREWFGAHVARWFGARADGTSLRLPPPCVRVRALPVVARALSVARRMRVRAVLRRDFVFALSFVCLVCTV